MWLYLPDALCFIWGTADVSVQLSWKVTKKSLLTCIQPNHEDVSPFLCPSPWGQKSMEAIKELQWVKYVFGAEGKLRKCCNEQEGQGEFVVKKLQIFCVKMNKIFSSIAAWNKSSPSWRDLSWIVWVGCGLIWRLQFLGRYLHHALSSETQSLQRCTCLWRRLIHSYHPLEVPVPKGPSPGTHAFRDRPPPAWPYPQPQYFQKQTCSNMASPLAAGPSGVFLLCCGLIHGHILRGGPGQPCAQPLVLQDAPAAAGIIHNHRCFQVQLLLPAWTYPWATIPSEVHLL